MGKISAKTSLILAIDTSCDDTSVAIVSQGKVLANVVASQTQIHRQYGGVFPTLAKQAHRDNIEACLWTAARQASLIKNQALDFSSLTAIAVTVGPGLAPALEVGIAWAKKLAATWQKPLVAVNHIEAHALSPLLRPKSSQTAIAPKFPSLAMVISGGHSEFILVKNIGDYERLGYTIDDSAGECLDKVGRLLDLGYPAGAIIEKFAKKGQLGRWELPLAMTNVNNFNLSFSGLKTAARQLIDELKSQKALAAQDVYDLAALIQERVFTQINYKLEKIIFSPDLKNKIYPDSKTIKKIKKQQEQPVVTDIQEIWLGGGVSANIALRQSLRATLQRYAKLSGKKIPLRLPYHKKYCADNAAMIALVAEYQANRSEFCDSDQLDRQPNLKITGLGQAC